MAPDEKLVVTFAPRFGEMFWATLVLIVGLGELAIGAAMVLYKPVTTIECDRKACHVSAPSLLAGRSDYTLDVSHLSESHVQPAGGGEQAWVVMSNGNPVFLGNPTSDDALIAQYEHLAKDLQAFLADPSLGGFKASFAGLGGPSPWLFAILGVVIVAWGVKWRRGWRVQITFDRAAGRVTFVRRPWAGTKTVALADVGGVDSSQRVLQSLYGPFRWELITMRDRSGHELWRFRTMFTRKTHEHVRHELAAMRDFLAARAS